MLSELCSEGELSESCPLSESSSSDRLALDCFEDDVPAKDSVEGDSCSLLIEFWELVKLKLETELDFDALLVEEVLETEFRFVGPSLELEVETKLESPEPEMAFVLAEREFVESVLVELDFLESVLVELKVLESVLVELEFFVLVLVELECLELVLVELDFVDPVLVELVLVELVFETLDSELLWLRGLFLVSICDESFSLLEANLGT